MHPPLTRFLDNLRRLAAPPGDDSDAVLLGRFARLRDEGAFAALMARHGPMVLNVCRRVLGDAHAAEDAFQATFLVLSRKASALRRPGMLPAWLYGVAHRVALKARSATARRRSVKVPAGTSEPLDSRPDPLAVLTARDLLRVLEEEIQGLPGLYRLPVVLCCLEGLSQEEAARRLGWTAGSVKGRLERGRAKLHARLVRRGLTLAAALATAEVSRGVAKGGLSPALAGSTTRAATEFTADANSAPGGVSPEAIMLAHRGLQAMYVGKLKAAFMLVVVVAVAGTGLGWRRAGNAGLAPAAAAPPDVPTLAVGADKPAGRQVSSLEKARNELKVIFERMRYQDLKSTQSIVEARERLVELEEQMREVRAEPLPDQGPGSEEAKLRDEEAQTKAQIDSLKQQSSSNVKPEILSGAQQYLDRVQKSLAVVVDRRAKASASKTRRVIELRKQIVRVEEHIGLLERERSAQREDGDRHQEAAAERVRELEGSSSVVGAEDRHQRATQRGLEALLREIAELRRDVQRLRTDKKE